MSPPEKGGDVGEEHFVAQICGQVAVVELEGQCQDHERIVELEDF